MNIIRHLNDKFVKHNLCVTETDHYMVVENSQNHTKEKIQKIIADAGYCALLSSNEIGNFVFTVTPYAIPKSFQNFQNQSRKIVLLPSDEDYHPYLKKLGFEWVQYNLPGLAPAYLSSNWEIKETPSISSLATYVICDEENTPRINLKVKTTIYDLYGQMVFLDKEKKANSENQYSKKSGIQKAPVI
jgi:hypothetical protein